ncbi:hypothetical protein B0H15DRAFT_900731 [Mycena belliarum]|uniref:BRCT domain-containing protein n=1 Tax=Mycena belliarum TaxID=1033014 RepID=A0AAD6XZM4_9AGAR|nr:hypothetical protein B0H15DRAFT_900731 [Mycena belliae]
MVFKGVKYYLPETLPEERRSELAGLLQQHNATRADSAFDATHIITNSDAFEEWRDVNSEEAAVVSDLWVERSIAANKIQNPSFYSASRSKIFSGVVACSADLRASDEEVISVGITSLGGQWRMGLTKDVTHLFAMSTTSEKYHTGMQYRDQTNIKVLVPDWFDHAVLFGNSGLSTDTYEWPDPSVLSRRPTVSPAQLEKAKRQQRLSMSPQKKALYKTAAWDPSKPKLQSKGVWGGYRILLSSTLELTGSRRQIVEAGIREAQGVPLAYSGDGTSKEELRLLDNCDVFITRYRTGDAFLKAWRRGTKIGTLSWLLNAQVTGVQTSPLDQILHFPIPAGAVQGFDKHEISVTNYTGEARDYLKKLITLMGGSFTPSLSIKNTVLVAAQMSGSKTAKAAEWSIPVVNHTWLEDCFLRWQCLTPALPKYISYPPGVDFSSILGTRGIGPDITEIAAKEGWDGGEEEQEQEKEKEKEKAGLSQNSADETEKVVHIKRPPSAAKPTPKRKGKAREEPEAEVSHDEDAEARKKAAVGARPRPRPLPKGKARAVESEAEASQPDEEEERPSPPKRALADLGAKVTGRATDCTHLVVAKLVRTEKFLCALAGAPFILTEQWALDSARAGELMPEEDYLLHDAAGESKYGFRLADALARARALKGALFKGHVFYLMPRVPTDPALLRSVVLANGGQLITNQQPTARALGGHEGRHVIGCKEDDAAARKAVGRVYSQEVVLTSALKQEVDWEGYSI